MYRQLIITCEHAGNEVPKEYQHLFQDRPEALETHRGVDIGALELTNTLAEKMERKAYLHTVTRLLVDLNRSVQSPTLFSEYTREISLDIREEIFEKYYQPHREKVQQEIEDIISDGNQAIHIGVHTFTPTWKNKERNVDVGFLFDPRSKQEQDFCWLWRHALKQRSSELRLKMNEPYRGTMDGFTTYLRRQYNANHYLGLEVEVNQRFAKKSPKEEWLQLQADLAGSLQETLQNFE